MSIRPPQFPRLQTDIPILNRVEDLIRQWGVDFADWIASTFILTGATIPGGTILLPAGPAILNTDASGHVYIDKTFSINAALREMQIDAAGYFTLYPVRGTNFERLRLYANGGQFWFQADRGGSGTKRALVMDFSDIFLVPVGSTGGGIVSADPTGVGSASGRAYADPLITISTSLHELQLLPSGGDSAALSAYRTTGTNFERATLLATAPYYQLAAQASGSGVKHPLNVDFSTVLMAHLAAGGIVYADVTTGELKLVTVGAGISFSGGTLSATGSGGTVTGVSGTAPIFITGGASPTPNVTIQGSIVSGATSTAAQNLGSLTTGLLKGTVAAGVNTLSTAAPGTDYQAPITWPAATRVLVSTGTTSDPGGDPAFTFDTSNHNLAAGNAVAINGTALGSNVNLVTGSTTNSNRDRVQFFLGGGTNQNGGTSDNSYLELFGTSTAVPVGVTAGIYATERIDRQTFTAAAGQTITEADALYIENAPLLTGVTGPTNALHVAAGNTKLEGGLQFKETGGPTLLTVGAIPDGQFLRRSGANVVGSTSTHFSQVFYVDISGAVTLTSSFISTAWNGTGTWNQFPLSTAYSKAQITLNILTNSGAFGSWMVSLYKNGSVTAASTGPISIGTTGLFGSGVQTVSINGTTDVVGIVYDGTSLTGGPPFIQFALTLDFIL